MFSAASARQQGALRAPTARETLSQYVVGWAPNPSLRGAGIEVPKVVTACTLAYSITLSLAVSRATPARVAQSR